MNLGEEKRSIRNHVSCNKGVGSVCPAPSIANVLSAFVERFERDVYASSRISYSHVLHIADAAQHPQPQHSEVACLYINEREVA